MLSSRETTTDVAWTRLGVDAATSCWDDLSRIMIVGLGFNLVLARRRGEDVDNGDSSGETAGAGSGIISLESIHVGGLFSSRERLMHHDPGRGPSRWSCAIKNTSFHMRATHL